jgi:hypothetical protein
MRTITGRQLFVGSSVLTITMAIVFVIAFWIRSPFATANKIASAISSKDLATIRPILGEEAVDSIRDSYSQIRGKPFTVHVIPDQRSLTQVFAGEQGFLITGYGGAHRFHIARGLVSNFRYTFISGVEYTR